MNRNVSQSHNLETKFCPDCGNFLSVVEFKLKGKNKEGGNRYDKYCLKHRRQRDNMAYNAKKNIDATSTENKEVKLASEKIIKNQPPRGFIEPRNNKTMATLSAINNSSDSDCLSGMPLSEKVEIVENFNQFVLLLLDGYSKHYGVGAYVKTK